MFYVTQERAMAPGIAGEWPEIIMKPHNPNGRLVRIDGLDAFLAEVLEYAEQNDKDEWAKKIREFIC